MHRKVYAHLSMALPPTRVDSRALYTPSASSDSPATSVVSRSTSVNSDVTPAPKCLQQTDSTHSKRVPHAPSLSQSKHTNSHDVGMQGIDAFATQRILIVHQGRDTNPKVVLMASTSFFRSSSSRRESARRLTSSFSRASRALPSASASAFSLCTFFSSSACIFPPSTKCSAQKSTGPAHQLMKYPSQLKGWE